MSRAVYNFLFFFLIIFSYYIAKPIRNSLFLEWMGPEKLPFVYLLSSFITFIGALLFEALLKKILPRYLVPSAFAIFALVLIFFRWAFTQYDHFGPTLSFILYLYISFFAVVSVTLFWTTCNDSFSAKEGKKYYGWIGLGGILGGIAGGQVTKWFAPIIGTENLLLVSAGILILSLPFPYLSVSQFHKSPAEKSKKTFERPGSGLKLIFTNKYVLCIAGIVFLGTFVATLFDFQFQSIIKAQGLTKDARTALFGTIFSYTNGVAILTHVFLTPLILKKLGSMGGLSPLPVLALLGMGFLWLVPSLLMVTILWSTMAGITYSLNQVSKETLYLPTSRAIKYQAKIYIDSFIYRFGDAFASLLLLLFVTTLKFPGRLMTVFQVAACIGWGFILFYLYKNFFQNSNPTASIEKKAVE